ncbi:hypothetical protein FQN60_012865 [Etheostoma spectabile]|uniref:Uncharacterized protein n=1 Tax=Etheostoma spectabile TaxID=54343 RepID=A0A5J5D9D0_9PERO|nr:hypothetical protein FQN60_012865 [Etheostoma spectabile]
MLTDTLAEMFA